MDSNGRKIHGVGDPQDDQSSPASVSESVVTLIISCVAFSAIVGFSIGIGVLVFRYVSNL